MQELSRIRVFAEVAKYKSFVQAGRALGMTGPAASKQVMALEEDLGVKLLHRTTRVVTLTDEGAAYYERAQRALEELQDAASEVRDAKSLPKGTLKINAPLSFGHQHLLPALAGFAVKYPDILMDIALEDRMADIITEGYDVVIRISAMKDSSLIMKALAECPIIAVASPKYLKDHGTPQQPKDLKSHRLVGYSLLGTAIEWRYCDKKGKVGSIKADCVLRANTAEMMLQAALDGVGIAFLPHFCASTFVKAGKLHRVLPDHETFPKRQIVALMQPNRHRSTKVKLFLDWLQSACKAIPDLD